MKMLNKMSALYLFLLVLVSISAKSATDGVYTPMLQEKAVWTEAYVLGYWNPGGTSGLCKYSLDGTVFINDVQYQKMYCSPNTEDFDPCLAEYKFAIREEENGKVWIKRPEDEMELLYVDFGMEIGESATVLSPEFYYGSTTTATVIAKDSVLIEGEYRDRLEVEIYCSSEYWIEGIGSTKSFIRDYLNCFVSDMPYKQLLCHQKNGIVNWQAAFTSNCNQTSSLGFSPFITANDTICKGETLLFEFSFGGLSGGVSPYTIAITPETGLIEANSYEFLVEPDATTIYTATITDGIGNTTSQDFTVVVIPSVMEPLVLVQENPNNECYSETIILYAEGDYASYSWTNGSIWNPQFYGNNPTLVAEEGGSYHLTVENEAGCSQTEQIYLYGDELIDNSPKPDVRNNRTGPSCEGDIVKYWTTESFASYDWNWTNLGPHPDTLEIMLGPGGIQVSVCVTDENGCSGCSGTNSSSTTATADIPTISSDGTTLIATSGNAEYYQWYLDGEAIPEAWFETYEPILSGTYTVGASAYPYGGAGGPSGPNGAVSVSEANLVCPSFSEEFSFESPYETIDIQVFLGGPYDSNLDLMSTILLDNCLLPVEQPYNGSPWLYNGNETVEERNQFPANAVDWILVEMRSGIPGLNVVNTVVEETVAAFVLSDGSVVAANGGSLLFENLQEGTEYHIAIRHRNHLDVISAEPIIAGVTTSYDFTSDVTQALGPEQMQLSVSGSAVLFPGDYNPNGIILNTDYDEWFALPAAVGQYAQTDGNLDGVVQATDYDLWFVNRSKIGVVEIQY